MATDKSIRIPGQATYASNFEVAKQALLDAREMILTTAADLVKPQTWEDEDGNVWLAKGLKVAVMNNGGTPDLYILKDPDNYTDPNSWHKVGDNEGMKPLVLNMFYPIESTSEHDLGVSFEELKAAVRSDRTIWLRNEEDSFLSYSALVDEDTSEVSLHIAIKGTLHYRLVFTSSTQEGKVDVEVIREDYDKSSIGLGNVTNDPQVKRSEMGKANGVATLGADGKVPTAQLPSYVDDVIDLVAIYPAKANIPTTGLTVGAKYFATSEKKIYTATSTTAVDGGADPETGKIYVVTSKPANATADVNTTWRWSGTAMAPVGSSLVLGTVTGTAFDGGKGQALQTWKEQVDEVSVVTGGSVGSQTATTVVINLNRSSLADGSETTAADFTIQEANNTRAGVMSAADKAKLNALPAAAEVVTSVVLEVETI